MRLQETAHLIPVRLVHRQRQGITRSEGKNLGFLQNCYYSIYLSNSNSGTCGTATLAGTTAAVATLLSQRTRTRTRRRASTRRTTRTSWRLPREVTATQGLRPVPPRPRLTRQARTREGEGGRILPESRAATLNIALRGNASELPDL